MKFNNHGWSVKEMIIYVCILLIFLFVATSLISSMYEDLSNQVNNTNNKFQANTNNDQLKEEKSEIDTSFYDAYEERMEQATLSYMNNVDIILEKSIYMVTLEDLITYGYIEMLYDQIDGSTCIGYSNIFDNVNGEYEVNSYVRCNNYVTEGY